MNFEKYKNKSRYPVEENYTTYVYYDRLNKVEVILPYAANDEKLVFLEKNVDFSFQTAQQAYQVESATLNSLFIKDLFEECEVPDNVLTSFIYGKAYETGHSGGYSEIANAFYALIDIYDIAEKFFKPAKG
jgi:hypothetical protein